MTHKEIMDRAVPPLLQRGESQKDMKFWQNVFRDLPPTLQEQLAKNLDDEIHALAANF